MADNGTTNGAQGYGQEGSHEPSPVLRALDRLVGTWELSGDVGGTVTYEWMVGGFILIQHVDLGPEAKGMEVIGHERTLGQVTVRAVACHDRHIASLPRSRPQPR